MFLRKKVLDQETKENNTEIDKIMEYKVKGVTRNNSKKRVVSKGKKSRKSLVSIQK